jgi:hypothetical protein
MNAVWFGAINSHNINPNLLVKTLVKILKMQLSRLIGLNFVIVVASASLGIKESTAKLSL